MLSCCLCHALHRLETVSHLLRPLNPSAIKLMMLLEHAQPQRAALAPHAYLLRELLRSIRLHMMPQASTSSTAKMAPCPDLKLTGTWC